MLSLGMSFDHDSGFTIVKNNKIEVVYPMEIHFNEKRGYIDVINDSKKYKTMINVIGKYSKEFDSVNVSCYMKPEIFKYVKATFPYTYNTFNNIDHRICHAISNYKMYNCDNALIVCIDSGGNGKTTFLELKDKTIHILENSFTKIYGILYDYISVKVVNSILNMGTDALDCAGKFMAYTSYGKFEEQYSKLIKELFCWNDILTETELFTKCDKIFKQIDTISKLNNFCFTFEKIWTESIVNEIYKYKNISDTLCVTGGSFLNCHLNRSLLDTTWFNNILFSPVSNDSGQHIGAALYNKPVIPFTSFCGPKVFDYNQLENYKNNFKFNHYNSKFIAEQISKNHIIGVLRDNMEIGPRALGHRSILANPCDNKIQTILNDTVKFRKPFQPYGAIIKRDKITEYFDVDIESIYMNVIVNNCTNKIPGVTHVDNTTRIQTVTIEQDELLYNILTECENTIGVPIVLNTSFNVNGKPIINRLDDAFKLLEAGQITGLIVDDLYFWK